MLKLGSNETIKNLKYEIIIRKIYIFQKNGFNLLYMHKLKKKILEYFTVSFNQVNAIKEFGTDCLSRMI